MSVIQACLLVFFAPLVQGVIKHTKAWMQGRKGPSVWQPYRELRKYFRKGTVLSDQSSLVTTVVPYLQLALVFMAAMMLPVVTAASHTLLASSDIFLFIYLLGFARLLTAVVGMDSGSAFGGMGISRDLFISLLVEPTVFLAILATGIAANIYSFSGLSTQLLSHPVEEFTLTHLLAAVALFMIVMTEVGRLPIDNPDTHLELTMIHEAAVLDLSGRHIALMSLGAWMRQLLWFTVFLDVCVPAGMASGLTVSGILLGVVVWIGKVFVLGTMLAALESVNAKMRLFAVPRFLTFALSIAVFALLTNFVAV